MKRGKKPIFQHEWIQKVHDLAAEGHTEKEIYTILGIGHQTFYLYKKNNPEFAESLRQGKVKPNRVIEAALYKRARGFKVKLKRMVMVNVTRKGITRQIPRILEVEEYYPPNPTSMIFFLKNRLGERWRDIWHGELSSPSGKNLRIVFDRGSMSPDKLPNEEGRDAEKKEI